MSSQMNDREEVAEWEQTAWGLKHGPHSGQYSEEPWKTLAWFSKRLILAQGGRIGRRKTR